MPKNLIPKQNLLKVEEIRMVESDFDKSQQIRCLENQNPKPPKDKKSETPPADKNQQNPVKKVLEWLVWKDQKNKEFYQVFGSWKCDNQKKKCGKGWNSAYTWILLQKYKENVPVKELDKNAVVELLRGYTENFSLDNFCYF